MTLAICAQTAWHVGAHARSMSDEQLQRGLHASVKIFNLAQEKLAELEGDRVELSREELMGVKRASASMNRALTALVRESHEVENRLTLELHMLRGIMKREHIDREANRARVFELLRRYNGGDDGTLAAVPSGAGSANTNALSAPSASALAVDKALSSLERMDQGVRELSPVGRVDIYGAGLLSAKLRMEVAPEAKRKRKRPKPTDAS